MIPTTLDGTRQQPHLHLLISARQNDAHTRTAATRTSSGITGSTPSAEAHRRTMPSGTRARSRRIASSSVMSSTCISSTQGWQHGCILTRLEASPAGPHARAEAAPQREPRVPRAGDRSVPACRRSSTSGRRGRSQGQRRNRHRRGGIGKDGRCELGITDDAAHGPQTLRDHRGPGTAPRSSTRAAQWWTSTSGGQHRSLATGSRRSIIRQTQQSYGNVAPKNQVRFRTEREAQQAGYRRAANDHYGPGTGVARTAEPTRAATLAGEFQRLTRLLDPEDGRGHGDLNVRLHDEERERDRGMSW